MVKGPQGIGKSHTLVNLALRIEEMRKDGVCPYHLTFIPDCDYWTSIHDFVNAVLKSFGVTLVLADVERLAGAMSNVFNTISLLDTIDAMLIKRNIKWIFIFDQVNALFGRDAYKEINDIHKLPFPYNLIGGLRKPRRILSIICASANNKVSHRDGHTGFNEYLHEISLTKNEATILYPDISQPKMAKALEETGAIPLQMYRLLVAKTNEDDYRRTEFDAINTSARKLLHQLSTDDREVFHDGIIQTLLKSPTTASVFDRKHFVDSPRGDKHCYEPLFPLVEEVYMEKFWDKVMEHIEQNERNLLAVCADDNVDQGSRGRHFELTGVA